MIAPRPRLILWVGIMTLPLAALTAMQTITSASAAGVLGAFTLLVLLDAALARKRLDGVNATLPEVVRFTRGRPGEIVVQIENNGTASRQVRMALAFPVEVISPRDDTVTIVPGHQTLHFAWPCTALRRGNFTIENVYIEVASMLGFWNVRKIAPARAEIRVYPNTLPEQKNLAALFLNRGLFGVHARRQVGKGKEFEFEVPL